MADFMGDDIGLVKIARRVETGLQVLVKTEIDVNLLILGAIEGAHGLLRDPAGRLHSPGEQDEFWLLVIRPPSMEDFPSGFFRIGQDNRNEMHPGVLAGWLLPSHRWRPAFGNRLEDYRGIDTKIESQDHQDNRTKASSPYFARYRHSPPVLHIFAFFLTPPTH